MVLLFFGKGNQNLFKSQLKTVFVISGTLIIKPANCGRVRNDKGRTRKSNASSKTLPSWKRCSYL